MARIASPWFWSDRNEWWVTKNGQKHFLGDHPAGAPAPRKQRGKWNAPPAILQAFHELMARPSEPISTSPPKDPTVAVLLDRFLDWCQKHRAPRTYEGHRRERPNQPNVRSPIHRHGCTANVVCPGRLPETSSSPWQGVATPPAPAR